MASNRMTIQTTHESDIRITNLSKSFRKGRDQVLDNVSITFPKGKLTYILGPSGVGKSVLLKHILGLYRPDSGAVWVGGKNISELEGRALAEHRLIFGMLFQNSALFDDMTVFDNVAFPLREHTKLSEKEIEIKVSKALGILGMREGFDKLPSELSGGMRKRVGLARAIIREPSVLLYDEPTTGLDPITRITVDDLIETLKRELKLTSIVISHDLPSALTLSDFIAFLFKGKIVFWGTPKEFRYCDHEIIQKFIQAEQRSLQAMSFS